MGDRRKDGIARALEAAQVAILLVSVSFLASDFVAEEELPKLLAAAEERGVRIWPVVASRTKLRGQRFAAALLCMGCGLTGGCAPTPWS